MVYPTPTKRSQSSSNEVSRSELSREEWISSFLLKAALRPQLRSLSFVWMIVVSAVVFPIGFWSQMDSVSKAEESQATNSNTAVAVPAAAETATEVPAGGEPVQATAQTNAVGTPTETQANTPAPTSGTFSLPALPDPRVLFAPQPRKMDVQVLVSGKVFKRQIEMPEKATVANAIAAFGLKVGELDRVYPATSTPVYDGQKIRITRVRTETKTRTVSIPPSVRYRPTAALRPGQEKTEHAGTTGVLEISERIWFKDGKVSLREPMGKETVRQPQDKVIAVGARPYYVPGKVPYHNRYAKAYTLAARAGSPRDRITSNETKSLRRVKSIVLTATGYSPHPSENGGYTVTATGLPISYGAAAVDPRVIPLGTKLYVEGYGYAFACDVGGAIKGKRIDLAYDSYAYANTKGHKKVKVWILAP